MRKNCETCKHDDAEYPSYPHKTPCYKCETSKGSNTPSEWEPAEHYKPDTNADRIRAMSDEELANIMAGTPICKERYMDCIKDGRDCEPCLLEWFKQPAEE